MFSDAKAATERVHLVPGELALSYTSKIEIGIPFLDDALIGILPTDLMMIGAKSGKGKTHLCTEIAAYNAQRKRKVLYILLEGEPNEIEMRLLFQLEASLFFNDPSHEKVYVDYRRWRLGELDVAFSKYRERAMELFRDRYSTLFTAYRKRDFTFQHLDSVLQDLAIEDLDLVVIDHLHYFDFEGRSARDEQHIRYSKLIKAIRDLNLLHRIPFVVAGHVRRDIKTLTPDMEDFSASSEIYKNASVITMLSPVPDGYNPATGIFDTLFTLPKTRTGSLGNTCGILYFSTKHQCYSPTYDLGRVIMNQSFKKLETGEYPAWAKKKDTIK